MRTKTIETRWNECEKYLHIIHFPLSFSSLPHYQAEFNISKKAYYIYKCLDFQVLSDKDYKPQAPALKYLLCSLWDVKEPTHYSRKVGDEVPRVVAVLCECVGAWVGISDLHQLNSCQNFNLLKRINNKQSWLLPAVKRRLKYLQLHSHSFKQP